MRSIWIWTLPSEVADARADGQPDTVASAGHQSRFRRDLATVETSRLTIMHKVCIIVHMRTTLNIDAELLKEAGRLTGVSEKTSLVKLGLKALIAKESARRLAELGGTETGLAPIPRRRPRKAA